MAEFRIEDSDLQSLTGKVVLLTGCSSGIGLATTKLLLRLGALVVAGDLNPAPIEHDNLTFVTVNVTAWSDLSAIFKKTRELHGRIDHVFANAGIPPRTNWLDGKVDENGDLLEPDHTVFEINFKSVANTTALAFHYFLKQENGGSIVLTASGSSFQRFRFADYAAAKHGVFGIVRGTVPNLENLPIRINCIGPAWTDTGMVPTEELRKRGIPVQSADVPARAVAVLMADNQRQGQFIYSFEGRHKEIEVALLKKVADDLNDPSRNEDAVAAVLQEMAEQAAKAAEALTASANTQSAKHSEK